MTQMRVNGMHRQPKIVEDIHVQESFDHSTSGGSEWSDDMASGQLCAVFSSQKSRKNINNQQRINVDAQDQSHTDFAAHKRRRSGVQRRYGKQRATYQRVLGRLAVTEDIGSSNAPPKGVSSLYMDIGDCQWPCEIPKRDFGMGNVLRDILRISKSVTINALQEEKLFLDEIMTNVLKFSTPGFYEAVSHSNAGLLFEEDLGRLECLEALNLSDIEMRHLSDSLFWTDDRCREITQLLFVSNFNIKFFVEQYNPTAKKSCLKHLLGKEILMAMISIHYAF
ncbi:hypothetical protein Tco_0797483 [Tanacetum coccineum]